MQPWPRGLMGLLRTRRQPAAYRPASAAISCAPPRAETLPKRRNVLTPPFSTWFACHVDVNAVASGVSGFGFRVSGFGFRVSGFGFRVSGFGFRHFGTSALRHFGTSALRHFGSSALRHFGSSALRLFGSSALRLFGLFGSSGSSALRLFGSSGSSRASAAFQASILQTGPSGASSTPLRNTKQP